MFCKKELVDKQLANEIRLFYFLTEKSNLIKDGGSGLN